MWTRRGLWGFGFLAAFGAPKTAAATAQSRQPDVVYHLVDLDRVILVLGNIHNHFAGIIDEQVQLALVVHGAALRAFRASSASLDVGEAFRELVDNNKLQALACSNSLRAQGMSVGDLLPGFRAVDSGVVTIAQLQSLGYAYIRP
jgi:intracellular sulfur oxidation DsrE/DsrF family protein